MALQIQIGDPFPSPARPLLKIASDSTTASARQVAAKQNQPQTGVLQAVSPQEIPSIFAP